MASDSGDITVGPGTVTPTLSSTQQTANTVLNKETDSRFWVTTGYKPLQKLDPSIPTDRAQVPVWNAIHAQVVAEDHAGHLRLTYNDPAVIAKLAAAAKANSNAAAHLDAAATANRADTDDHVQAAAHGVAAAQQHVADAQAMTQHSPPPPDVVHAAAQNAASSPPPPDARGAHHIGHHQGQTVPATVAASAAPKDHPPNPPTIDPTALGVARLDARQLADATAGNFVGVTHLPGALHGQSAVFPSRDALINWYNDWLRTAQADGYYVAAFDKTDPVWPEPIADGMGAEAAIIVAAHSDAPYHDPWANTLPVAAAPTKAPWHGGHAGHGPVAVPQQGPAPASHPDLADVPNLSTPDAPKICGSKTGTAIVIVAGVLGAVGLVYLVSRETKHSSPASPRFSFRAMARDQPRLPSSAESTLQLRRSR
jgi:hypothetical protein